MPNDDRFARIGKCLIDPSAKICIGAVIGKPFRPFIGITVKDEVLETVIGPHTYVGYYSLVGSGTAIEAGVVLDDFSVIECSVNIGQNTLVIYHAQICNEARIGRDCVIGGFVGERVIVGNRSRVFGKIVHLQHNPSLGWDAPEAEEGSATIEDDVFVGFDAIVIGQVNLGAGAYICAGSIVTRNVPSRYVAYGVNKMVPHSEWRGPLHRSAFFQPRISATNASESQGEQS